VPRYRRTIEAEPIAYAEFRQRVRRFTRSGTLRAVAGLNAHLHRAKYGQGEAPSVPNFVTPFALSGIARTALLAGNDHRDSGPTPQDLERLCFDYANVEDPQVLANDPLLPLRHLMNRIAYEQFDQQFSVHENLGRTLALLIDHAPGIEGAPTPDDWEQALGCSLEHFIRLGFSLHVAAVENGGSIDVATLRMPHIAVIFEPVGTEQSLTLIERWFSADPNWYGPRGRELEVAGLEKWSFNPLVERPVVRLDGQYVIPWPWLCLHRVTPAGLYYIGLAEWGSTFTDALGLVFESYVGSQLATLSAAQVTPEIVYDKSNGKTVDFFLVTPEVVVLVEVKSARPVMGARVGDASADQDVIKKVGHAFRQIDGTLDLMASGHPSLASIPTDRPARGLVVTLEPFHLVNTFFYDDVLQRPAVPSAVVSAHELETLVGTLCRVSDLGERLLRALTPSVDSIPNIQDATSDLEVLPNEAIFSAWERFYSPWAAAKADSEGPS
jgi:hypothetical protein